jgi:hypothetical protein
MTSSPKKKHQERAEILERMWMRTAQVIMAALDADEAPSAAVLDSARKFLHDQSTNLDSLRAWSSTLGLLGITNLPTFSDEDDVEDPKLIEARAVEVKAIASEAQALQSIPSFVGDDPEPVAVRSKKTSE